MTRNDEKIKQRKTTRQQNKLRYMKNINKQYILVIMELYKWQY